MSAVVVFLLVAPVLVALVALRAPVRVCQVLTVTVGVLAFAGVLFLVPGAAHGETTLWRYLRVDAISVVFLLATSFLYAVVAAYSIGYLRAEESNEDFGGYARRFYVGINLFAWSMLAAPAATPRPIVERLSAEVTRIVQSDDVAARIFAYGFQPEGGTPQAAQRFLQAESTRWAAAIQATGVTME